jgi:hypothetical protein
MHNRPLLLCAISVLLTASLLAGCGSARPQPSPPSPVTAVWEEGGIKQVTAVRNGHIAFWDGQTWQTRFWAGVNLGATTPGHAPGELSPRKADYRRWFPEMKAMNARVIRVYTILPPAFYEALAEFNATQTEPLWLLQGIWSPEEALIGPDDQGTDAFAPATVAAFQSEIDDAVRVIHGDAEIPERHGHAGGTYKTDVSRYLLGWLVGTEWHQRAVLSTNEAHPGMAPYSGTYFQAKPGANPFENWLAAMLDHLGAAEMEYGWQHPAAFVNWPTTDPLAHPEEPNREEDLVSVDPTHVGPSPAWTAGYFAAYHIYPYYPDFMRYDPQYQSYRTVTGQVDPYAGYLHAIRAYHQGIPFIVAEFGVPSSRGMAHRAPLDRNQGMHTETEEGQIDAAMLGAIHDEGFDGGIVFAWQDEWHKFTWNTSALELPADRRPMWLNRFTNEEMFGMLAVDPGRLPEPIYLDGKADDWAHAPGKAVQAFAGFDLSVVHDEAYLYLLLQKTTGSWSLSRETVYVAFSTLGKGATRADKAPGVSFSTPAEFLLKLNGDQDAHIYVNSAYDQHTFTWGVQTHIVPVDPAWKDPSAGRFLPWRLMLNRPVTLRQSGSKIPGEEIEVGVLKPGMTNPADPAYNSLADWYADGNVLEIRLPWMFLGFTDPSSLSVWQYPYQAGKLTSVSVDSVRVEPHIVSAATPASPAVAPLTYAWAPWDQPRFRERKKAAYDLMAEAIKQYQDVRQ